jgi:phosphoribosyl 1,2-cyclic phosphate phosphodiesterase
VARFQAASKSIAGEMILLGTGTSVGVPVIGCGCETCTSLNPKNHRTRCSAILGLPRGNLLIDTAPELRLQLIREGISLVNGVLYTHEHADHIFGLDDLRIMQFYIGGAVPLYCTLPVEQRIRKSFDYAFSTAEQTHAGARPALEFCRIGREAFEIFGQLIEPVLLQHGPRFEVLGFRFGNVAYCTDTNRIDPESMAKLQGLDVLILDALRQEPHATHFSLDQAIEVARILKVKQTYFTHVSCYLEYEKTNAMLPPGMALAYDGLRIPLT